MRLFVPGMKLCTMLVGCFALIILARWTSSPVLAGESKDLSQLSIEELMNIEITSVSKKSEPLSKAPAAAYVITSDDIRRSGYTTVPELLRLVPGLEVARIDLNTWAISARGFNGQYASKLLVLIDGRSVYSPLFSGVFWDQQDLVLEDIDRIEVIRGPGATMWGANAVNGVINIITKESSHTQGVLVKGESGADKLYGGTVRFGGTFGKKTSFRVFAKGFNQSQKVAETVTRSGDQWNRGLGGFRLDSDFGTTSKLTVLGDISSGSAGAALTTPQLVTPYSVVKLRDTKDWSGSLLTRYERIFSSQSQATLQLYYDRRVQNGLLIKDKGNLFDIDFQHHWSGLSRNEFVWGLGFRITGDRVGTTEVVTPKNSWMSSRLFSGFIQDEISIVKRRLQLTLGSKFEHNSLTKFEVQPNVRLLWTPHERHSLWSSVARAVRTPSIGERQADIVMAVIPPLSLYNPSQLPIETVLQSSPGYKSEILAAYEIGYTVRPADYLGLSIDGFYNDYSKLRTFIMGTPVPQLMTPVPYVLMPLELINGNKGHTRGIELSVEWRPYSWWRLLGAYTYLTSHSEVTSAQRVGSVTEDIIPAHQAWLRSSFDIDEHFEFDLIPRYVSKQSNSTIGEYTTCDFRVCWKPIPAIDFFVAGQNVIGPSHYEFDAPFSMQTVASKTGSTIYVGMTCNFGKESSGQ